jgi:hypothetical protein
MESLLFFVSKKIIRNFVIYSSLKNYCRVCSAQMSHSPLSMSHSSFVTSLTLILFIRIMNVVMADAPTVLYRNTVYVSIIYCSMPMINDVPYCKIEYGRSFVGYRLV